MVDLLFQRSQLKDLKRRKRYERIFGALLRADHFTRAEIEKTGEGKWLISRILNGLKRSKAIRVSRGGFEWEPVEKEAYRKEWLAPAHQTEQPLKVNWSREKPLRYEAEKLTPPELLATFLQSGVEGENNQRLATELLNRFGSIRGILEASTQNLLAIKGLDKAKLTQLKAIYALAEQYLKEKAQSRRIGYHSKELFNYLYQAMHDMDQEVFKLILLNGQNEILEIADLFKGPITNSNIYSREVIKLALKHHATAAIFAHNHPASSPQPSPQDRKTTKLLLFACRYAGIRVLDHIIIGQDGYFSFADEGLIEEYDRKFETLRP